MIALPQVWPSSTCRIASGASWSGNLRSMTGTTLPLSMRFASSSRSHRLPDPAIVGVATDLYECAAGQERPPAGHRCVRTGSLEDQVEALLAVGAIGCRVVDDAIWTVNVPTPPDAPTIRTLWPALIRPWSRMAWRAVDAASGTAAAWSNVRRAGFLANLLSGTDTSSAKLPKPRMKEVPKTSTPGWSDVTCLPAVDRPGEVAAGDPELVAAHRRALRMSES